MIRILVHDYAGHPFTYDLAKVLARKGHDVTYAYFVQDPGPKGEMQAADPRVRGLSVSQIDIPFAYSKTDYLRRRRGDIEYGRRAAALVEKVQFDLVLSGNTATESQEYILNAAQRVGASFVYWCQDFYSIAVSRLLAKKMPGIGNLIGRYYRFLERRQMRKSSHVIHITEDFRRQTEHWGIANDKVSIIPNWGMIDSIPTMERDMDWAREQGLESDTRYLYSGTLALKHNPEILASLARNLSDGEELVLVSSGVGVDSMAAKAGDYPKMRILPLQPFDRFPEVLAAADVLLAVIDRDAGEFSVPSKVLSYLCAGRPIVLAAPRENLAARTVTEAGAGRVVEPEDLPGFVAAARELGSDKDEALRTGQAGRAYAEANFRIADVVARFEEVFEKAVGH